MREGRVAIFNGPHVPLSIQSYPVTLPEAGMAQLRMLRSGICGTDLHIAQGRLAIPPRFIPGHECVGEIEAVGDTTATDAFGQPIAMGDLAIACVAEPCGTCFMCRQGETASCLHFEVTFQHDPDDAPHFFGGFGEFLFHPTDKLIIVPPTLALDAVAAFPCAGPTIIRACAYAGELRHGELVVVQGTGPVGLFAIAWAVAAGCSVIAISSSSHPARETLARQLGALEVLDYRTTTVESRLQAVQTYATMLGRGDGADVVIEATGVPSVIPEGMQLKRTRGRYLIPGQYSSSGDVEISPQLITFRALSLIGSAQYTLNDVAIYLAFLRQHPEVQRVAAACITHRFAIADANDALATISAGQVIKGVFVG